MADVAIDFVAGTVGGAAAVLIEHPFDTVKVLMQAGRYDGYLSSARGVLATEGPLGFYRGMAARLVASGFEHAIVFASYKYAIRACGGDEDRPKAWQIGVGGIGSGIAAMVCLTPFELVKCKLQAGEPVAAATAAAGGGGGGGVSSAVKAGGAPSAAAAAADGRPYSGSWDCAKKVYRTGGVRALYKGGVATLYREVPGTAAWCGTYDFMKMRMCKPGESPKDLPLWQLMFAGGCSGVAFWTVMYPADVVKTRMQVDSRFDGMSFAKAMGVQYKEHGLRGLYKGWALTAARSFPSNAVIFMFYDLCSRNLTRWHHSWPGTTAPSSFAPELAMATTV